MNALTVFAAISVILCSTALASQQDRAQCGDGNLSGSNGSFTSPNYPKNYDNSSLCQWLIEVPPGYVVLLYFSQFESAQYDYLYIYDGNNASAPLIRKIYGSYPQLSIYSSTNIVFVRFVTDDSGTKGGFYATYSAVDETYPGFCGDVHLGGSNGSFVSPNYPGNYGYDLNCNWHIEVPQTPGYVVRVDFPDFSTESSYDYVYIYDGYNESARQLRSLSGSASSGSYVYSSTNQIFVKFMADSAKTARGFLSTYSSVDEKSNPGFCGNAELSDYNGTFTSPNYPGNYGKGVKYNCTWHIQAPETRNIIRLDIRDFSMDAWSSYDVFYVYDGYNASAPVLGWESGASNPFSLYSSTDHLFIQFWSASAGGYRGFKATYTTY